MSRIGDGVDNGYWKKVLKKTVADIDLFGPTMVFPKPIHLPSFRSIRATMDRLGRGKKPTAKDKEVMLDFGEWKGMVLSSEEKDVGSIILLLRCIWIAKKLGDTGNEWIVREFLKEKYGLTDIGDEKLVVVGPTPRWLRRLVRHEDILPTWLSDYGPVPSATDDFPEDD